MIRVSVLYPAEKDATFDMAYYKDSHMPLVRERLGSALLKEEIWTGLGAPGNAPASFQVVLHMYFDDPDAFGASFGPHAGEIMADIPNYTNVQPVVQLEAAG